MSELVSEGHNEAPDYPIAFVWEEVQIVADRKNRILASEATILQRAINTGVALAVAKDGGKKASADFRKLVKSLLGDDIVSEEALPPTPAQERLRKRRERRNT
ncbi:hypothetical protein [Aquamicrobium zhengzhouense]|uniref:Uncharacterized protein n=1 Tax=Aquamicrobium zhengzhouense TaxID=2781738 RepID=A0ABS0SBK3_9HYPH|nr:hypothetical protein [Aquamicrobium zhengzhouense]MBI1620020.1 hypothetical protein [Aquamicrobium zhengzhouense]